MLAWPAPAVAAAAAEGTRDTAAGVRDHPLVAGSSTMYPFAVAVAQREVGRGALVLPMGTGAGIAWFCEGLGPATPDVAIASRAMTPEEASACRVAGAVPMSEFEVGRDGIVIGAHPDAGLRSLTRTQLWLALAQRVPDPAGGSRWIANPYTHWNEIGAGLPAMPIRVLGPPATSGTRDSFARLAIEPACRAALRTNPESGFDPARCGELRRDGAWVDAGENDDGLVARLQADPVAVGVFGFGTLVRNAGRVAAVCIDGVCPDMSSIAAGDYPLARALYLYVKRAHRDFVPGLDEFVAGFFSPGAIGPGGWLLALGLVPVAGASPEPALTRGQPASFSLGPKVGSMVLALALLGVLLALLVGLALLRRAAPVGRMLQRSVGLALWGSTGLAAGVLALVWVTLLVPTMNFFLQVSPLAFLGGTHWSPESAIRAAQAVGEGAFGVLPVLLGSVMVALIALLVALPLALATALHSYAWTGARRRARWRVAMRLAALVPAVVYGLFAVLTLGPLVAAAAASLGMAAATQSTLAAGVAVGIMLLPVLTVRLEEALDRVPRGAAEAALGLGATRWETLRDIVLPQARPGIGAAVLLAVSRALGETVIVLMAAGLVATWSVDPLGATTTLTAQMVALMSGTHALDNVRTQLPFVLGLFLVIIVLPLNAWALRLLRRSDVAPSPIF
nr:substrate-binding domain-containing protein [Wenzhouxiangella sp. XN24]